MTNDEMMVRYFLARILWWRHDLEQLEAEAVAELITTLEATQADLRTRLLADADELARIDDWTLERMQQANAWLDEALAGARSTMLATVTESTLTAAAASLAAYNAIVSFEGAARAVRTVGMSRPQISQWFQETTLGGGTLDEWIDAAFDDGVKGSILGALRKAGIEGKGTAATVRSVMDAAIDAGGEITRREAVTLTRTFTQTANVRAQDAVFSANESLFNGYRYVATLDNKTCFVCAVADGAQYEVGEKRPPLPRHPRCRCVYVPVCKSWADWGFNGVTEFEEVARPWTLREPGEIGAGGRKILNVGKTTENYSGWWASLPEEEKATTAIGPVRRSLLREGNVSWDDLWERHTGRVKTLKELGYDQRGGIIR